MDQIQWNEPRKDSLVRSSHPKDPYKVLINAAAKKKQAAQQFEYQKENLERSHRHKCKHDFRLPSFERADNQSTSATYGV